MKVVLSQEEALEIIHNALCNSSMLAQCGIQLNYTEEQYLGAKERLLKENPDKGLCREDVWLEILKGEGKLGFYDSEGEEDLVINLDEIVEKLSLPEASEYVLDMVNERDDACTASAILEMCLYGEVVFG